MGSYKILTCVVPKIALQHRLAEGGKYIGKLTRSMSTANLKDIQHFEKFVDIWWDEKGQFEILHKFNPLRIQLVRDGLANTGFKSQNPSLPLQGIRIADVGCGGGILSESLARTGAQVTGVDASEKLINIAKQHVELNPDISERINYVQTTIEEFSEKNELAYDAVIASEVVEHVENTELFLKECVRILKPRGSIFITTPHKTLISWFSLILMAEYILRIIPPGTHSWDKFIPPHDVQHVLDKYGCKTKLLHGYFYNVLIKQWSWSSNTAFCYALHAVKQKKIDT